MDNDVVLLQRTRAWLTGGVLESSYQAYLTYLIGRGYSSWNVRKYSCSVAHFAYWLRKRRAKLSQIDEALIRYFLDEHLPQCDCPLRTPRSRHHVEYALKNLLVVLRQRGDIPRQPDFTPRWIQEEIREFDAHLDQVCGLAASTRRLQTGMVRTFLFERFGASRINVAQVKPEHVHRFVVSHLEGCKPSTGKRLGIALRSYLRFRGMHGDHVLSLIAAIPQIAQWRFESLPDTLSEAELERFLNAFDRKSAIGRRNYAMARCMVDLGLRAGEVASLQLDDLNWQEGTLRLSAGKARRTDVLPLPPRTGRAIAQYLTDGRPVSESRAVFLRHRAPLIEPVGSSVVRNTVRAAHARCGNDPRRRGTHVLRHSVGSRLVQAGVPMKEIADILRHRCLDTTAIYTTIDISSLARVALPWPGRAS
ncbi:Site-specific recombinase XerD [Burkholderia sp. YR290]|nr:Site-specific recombinase XerD [Burkholderia sp. YR290]